MLHREAGPSPVRTEVLKLNITFTICFSAIFLQQDGFFFLIWSNVSVPQDEMGKEVGFERPKKNLSKSMSITDLLFLHQIKKLSAGCKEGKYSSLI